MDRIDSLNMNIAPPVTTVSTAATDEDFGRVFSEAATRALTESTLSGLSGTFALPADDSFSYLQSMLLTNTAKEESGGHDLLLYLLISMMQEFKSCDMAPLITVLTALLPGNVPGNDTKALKPSRLENPAPYTSSLLPTQAWLPASFNHTSAPERRNAATLKQVIGQFNVESATRYLPGRNNTTYCNIFVWDVTRALGCEIPHYVDKKSGAPRVYPHTEGAYELDANGVYNWLVRQGADYGWREVTPAEAQYYANAGYPAVTAWHNNGGGAGHVQIICPSQNGDYDPVRGVTVAQAGSRNFAYAHINATMGADKIAQTRYFVHE